MGLANQRSEGVQQRGESSRARVLSLEFDSNAAIQRMQTITCPFKIIAPSVLHGHIKKYNYVDTVYFKKNHLCSTSLKIAI